MKKALSLILAALMICCLFAGCAAKNDAKQSENTEAAEPWSRDGYFEDDGGNILTVTYMELDTEEETGWYVALMLGEDVYFSMVPQEGDALKGKLSMDEGGKELAVTVTEEGEDGLQVVVEGGETYHFKSMELPEPAAVLHVEVEGMGHFNFWKQGEQPEEQGYPWTWTQQALEEPATYVVECSADEGSTFVKWKRNGEDYSTDEQIEVTVEEDVTLVAVFEYAG